MSVVLDASVTLTGYFEDETTPATEAVLDHVSRFGAVVPSLWRLEVANVFQSATRRGRMSPAYRERALAELSALPIAVDAETCTHAWSTTLSLSDRFGLTIYGATYLECARRRGLPLATLDRALRDAAKALDVTLLGLGG